MDGIYHIIRKRYTQKYMLYKIMIFNILMNIYNSMLYNMYVM